MIVIHDYLSEGIDSAISGRDLCELLNIAPRELNERVEAERRAGVPICATSNNKAPGFYLASDRETMTDYCKRLEHREKEIRATRRACEKTARRLPARGPQ